MTVRVDQPGHQPDAGRHRLSVADGFGPDNAVDHPQVAVLTVRQHHPAQVEP